MRNREWVRQYGRMQEVRELVAIRLVVGEPIISGKRCIVPMRQVFGGSESELGMRLSELEKRLGRDAVTAFGLEEEAADVLEEVVVNGRGRSVPLRQALREREVEFDFTFEWEAEDVELSNDFIIIHVGYEVGSMYRNIDIQFPIREKTLSALKEITEAQISATAIIPDSACAAVVRDKWAMSFSGGMDSTAMRVMCPELVATTALFTDPGSVERVEQSVCEKLGTNFVIGTSREHIGRQTLGGAIVLGMMPFVEKEKIGLIATGKLHTDNVQYLLRIRDGKQVGRRQSSELAFGVLQVDAMMGFTKFGVYDVLHRLDKGTYETLVPAYFNADDPTIVSQTGRYLLDAATTGVGRNIDLSHEPKLSWHTNIYFGHYVLKKLGRGVLENYMTDIPQGIESQTEGMSLDFMLKYDQNMLVSLPADFREYFEAKLKSAGVQLFSEADYSERQMLLEMAFGPAQR